MLNNEKLIIAAGFIKFNEQLLLVPTVRDDIVNCFTAIHEHTHFRCCRTKTASGWSSANSWVALLIKGHTVLDV